MIEAMIETWKTATGRTDFVWSVWQDGKRVVQGDAHETDDDAEHAARSWCTARLGCAPDLVTRL